MPTGQNRRHGVCTDCGNFRLLVKTQPPMCSSCSKFLNINGYRRPAWYADPPERLKQRLTRSYQTIEELQNMLKETQKQLQEATVELEKLRPLGTKPRAK